DEIRKVLPHRYPMLLVDRVTELVAGQRLTAVKAVTANEPWYATGGGPAYPPVLVVESWCQAAGVLAPWHQPNPDLLAGQVMLFGSIANIRFVRPVLPGDVLEHRVRLARLLTDSAVFEGETVVDGHPVMTVERIVMAWRPAEVLRGGSGESDEVRRSV